MGFIYTGIRVRSLNRSIKFYKKLGLTISGKGTMLHGGKFVGMVDKKTGLRLELNWYPKQNKYYRQYKNGDELDHLAFDVFDAEETFNYLIKNGATPAVKPFGDIWSILAYVKDPDGIWIELISKKSNRRKSPTRT